MPIFLLLLLGMGTIMMSKNSKFSPKFSLEEYMEAQKKMNDVNRELANRRAMRVADLKKAKKAHAVELCLQSGEKADRAEFENEALKERIKVLMETQRTLIDRGVKDAEKMLGLEKDLATAKAAVHEHAQTIVTTQKRIDRSAADAEKMLALEKDLATAKAAVHEHTQTIVTTQRRALSSGREASALRKLVRIFFDEREAVS